MHGESSLSSRTIPDLTSPVELLSQPAIAIVIPCFNEEQTIGDVVRDFRKAAPNASIYVYDNASTDRTADVARTAGAIVCREPRKGKGNVVRRMLANVRADIYVMVDGDDTYNADAVSNLIETLIAGQHDMVVGARAETSDSAYRTGHIFGNWMLTKLVSIMFGTTVTDMLSGYRVMSRRFAKSFPALSSGFEIETELTVHALEIGASVIEIPTSYKERPEGSESKLNSVRDGMRIVRLIFRLLRDERPLEFFGFASTLMLLGAAISGWPVIAEYFVTGEVPRQPTWVLAVGMAIVSFLSFACGVILDGVARNRRESRRLAYLALPEKI